MGTMGDVEEVEKFAEDAMWKILRRNPLKASAMGIRDFDAMWPDTSIDGVREDMSLMKGLISVCESTPHSREKSLLQWYLKASLVEMEEFRYWEHAPNATSTIISGLNSLLMRKELDEEALRTRLSTAHEVIAGVKTRVTEPVALWVRSELRTLEALFILLKDMSYPDVPELVAQLGDYRQWLEGLGGCAELPTNREGYLKLLALRKLGYSADQLKSLAESYLERTEKNLEQLLHTLGGESVGAVRKKIREDHPDSFEDALSCYKELAVKAREFIVGKNLLTFPEEKLEVVYSKPFMRQFLSIAAAGMPPRFAPDQTGYFYLTPHKDKKMLEEHSYAFQSLLISHESYPGHHLHGACRNTSPSMVRSGVFASPSANSGIMYSSLHGEVTEGWGLYCERMMFDHGFENSPVDLRKEFILENALRWRATRVIVDIDLHTGKLSYEEAVNLLMKNTGYNRKTAESEVLMYSRSPGYFLSYLLGTHLLMGLKEDCKLPEKEFHDRIVYAGVVPYWFLRDHVLQCTLPVQE